MQSSLKAPVACSLGEKTELDTATKAKLHHLCQPESIIQVDQQAKTITKGESLENTFPRKWNLIRS